MKEYGTLCSVDTAIDSLDVCEAVNAYANNNEEHFLEETYSWEDFKFFGYNGIYERLPWKTIRKDFPSPIRSVENANLQKGCYYSKERFTRGSFFSGASDWSINGYWKILFNKVERTNFKSDSPCQYESWVHVHGCTRVCKGVRGCV